MRQARSPFRAIIWLVPAAICCGAVLGIIGPRVIARMRRPVPRPPAPGVTRLIPDTPPKVVPPVTSRIVYATPQGIYAIRPDGARKRRQLKIDEIVPGDDFAVSTDGKRAILMLRDTEDFDCALAVCELGRRASQVSRLAARGRSVAISADGRKVAWLSSDPSNSERLGNIMLANWPATHATRLVTGAMCNWMAPPAFSPEGTTLLDVPLTLNDAPDTGNPEGGIWEIGIRGGGPHQLLRMPDAATPSYSPDGRKIVFAREDGIYLMHADGSNMVRITSVKADRDADAHAHPVISPDGRRIAFTRLWSTGRTETTEDGEQKDEQAFTVCVVNLDGTGLKRLVRGWSPCWIQP